MNSRGWKISLLVLSALAISACGYKKKHPPQSPYQGIWMEQRSVHAFSAARASGDCRAVVGIRKAFIVHPNGEVFSYLPDAQLSAAEARDYYLGSINEASIFAPIDGQRMAVGGFYSGDMDSVGLQPNSRLILDSGILYTTSRFGQTASYVPVTPDQARRVWVFIVRCQQNGAGVGVIPVPVQPGMVPQGPQYTDQGYAPQYPNQGQRGPRQDDK